VLLSSADLPTDSYLVRLAVRRRLGFRFRRGTFAAAGNSSGSPPWPTSF